MTFDTGVVLTYFADTPPEYQMPPTPAPARHRRQANKQHMRKQQTYFHISSPKRIVVFFLLLVSWCATTWLVSGNVAMHRIAGVADREYDNAKITAENISANINQRLAQVRSIPFVMASDSSVVSVLMQFGPAVQKSTLSVEEKRNLWLADPALHAMTQRLNKIRAAIDLHTLFILNAAGDCIAGGKPPELPVFIGVNYADRQYFLEAQRGKSGRQFAVGRTDNISALFYSEPVLAAGQFIGTIVSRINVKSLTNLVLDQNVFASDENGVVILAKDPDLLMKALPGKKCLEAGADDMQRVYKQRTFETLDLSPVHFTGAPGVVQWRKSNYPYVYASITTRDELVTVHVLRDLKQLVEIHSDRILWSTITSFAGILLLALVFGIVTYVQSIARHRRELVALNEHLALQARTDALTGCANRRSFFESLESERSRGIRYRIPFSMLSLDIDYFKHINDIHGHPGGDQVLRHLVSTVEKIIRPTDRLGRVGGEEFGILLPQTTGNDAVLIAERIRKTAENSPAIYEQASIPFTVSIGVAQWNIATQETMDALINRSDKALYDAKNSGRNQVKIHE